MIPIGKELLQYHLSLMGLVMRMSVVDVRELSHIWEKKIIHHLSVNVIRRIINELLQYM